MKILAISDRVVDWIYSPRIRTIFTGIDLAVSCGDLPSYYLEYIVSNLDIPLFYVNGNHSVPDEGKDDCCPSGCINLNGKVIDYKGYLFAGIEGSLQYNNSLYQYSQFEMGLNIVKLLSPMLMSRLKRSHPLNVFLTHAPPWGIHDQPDLPHQGIKAFRWFLDHFRPAYQLHGHIHVYRPDQIIETQYGKTKVMNVYGYKIIDL